MKICLQCSEEVVKSQNTFCSRSCSTTYRNRAKLKRRCEVCDQLVPKNNRFCTKACETLFRRKERVSMFNSGSYSPLSVKSVSAHLRQTRGERCEECGWDKRNPHTNKVPLQVHHEDGNWINNDPKNLKLICPNCHSLTNTFGFLNKGNGRKYRYQKEAT